MVEPALVEPGNTMPSLLKFLHVAAAIFWLGGMAFTLFVLRPVAIAQLPPPTRISLLTAALRRFFAIVWLSIAVLLATGAVALAATGMRQAPIGWHMMLGLGLLMFALFGHLYFGPFRRLRQAATASDWPAAAKQLARIHPLVVTNFVLGWLAVAAVMLLR